MRFAALALVAGAPAHGSAQVKSGERDVAPASPNTLTAEERAAGWQLLFNGVSLDGWKASDKPGTFSVANGQIVVRGPTSHLFYLGPVQHHDFTDFELRRWHGDRGLAWLDTECRRRFTRAYADCDEGERHQVLDDIAFPEQARPEMQYGVEFFTGMRNFTASGFYSSKMGYEDLRYVGNAFNPGYNGCPEAALSRLGVSYAEWDARYSAREAGRRSP